MLDFKKPASTRAGSEIKIYEVYRETLIGAWYDNTEDRWIPTCWTLSGYFLPVNQGGKQFKSSLDLVNVAPYKIEPEYA